MDSYQPSSTAADWEKSDARRAEILPRLRRVSKLGTIGLVVVGLTFLFFYWVERRSNEWVYQSQVVGRVAREARALSLDRETAIRGFLLSRQEASLQPEIEAKQALRFKIDSLIHLSSGNASQQDRAKAIGAAIDRWDRGWAAAAVSRAVDGRSNAESDLAGKELFDSIRAAFDSYLAGQQRMYDRVLNIQSTLQIISLLAALLEIALLIFVLQWLARRSVVQANILLDQQDQLELQTRDLEQQAVELEEQAAELEEQTNEANENATRFSEANAKLEETVRQLESAHRTATTLTSQHEETRDLLDFVLNSSPVGISLRDENLTLVRVNNALMEMTGLTKDDLSSRFVDQIMIDDVGPEIEATLKQVIATNKPVTSVPLTGAAQGDPQRVRHFLANFFPVNLPGGKRGAATVMLDTTQYRQLEDQLLQAQKMEAVGRLAGGVAHDFNNMLTAIVSYSDLLLADLPADSPMRGDVQEIAKAADKATILTKKLLAFSRQQVLRPSTVNLNSTVEGLRKMLRRVIPDDIELTCNLAPKLWAVNADTAEVERVLMNLVLNSRDAMPDGGKLIIETSNVVINEEYAQTHADTIPGTYVMIAVTDTGIGMTREVREKVFEPFFTTKEKGKGTGLGLPSAYGIVRQSGGFIWVYSEPGRGTTFKVYLPRADEAVSTTPSTPRKNGKIGGETILLVEDDDEVRQVATRILRKNGYRVLEAANGADALKVCADEKIPVDLIVTDIVMPEMGGPELAERLRESQPDARILFTSGYTEDAAVRQSFLDPGEAFIEKPFTPASLASKAREVLDANGTS